VEPGQRGVVAERVAILQRGEHGAERGDARHVLGARTQRALLPAAGHQGGERRALADVEQADTLGGIQLVAGERGVVDAAAGQVQRQLAQRLHAVDHPQRGAAFERGLDAVEVADHAGLVVGGHRAHQAGARRVRAQPGEVVAAVLAHGYGEHLQAQAQHGVPVAQRLGHGLVLGGAVQQQLGQRGAGVAARAQGVQRRHHRRLDALGGPAQEQQLAGGRAQHAAGAGACRVHQRARLQAGAVGAAGVAEVVGHRVQRGGAGQGQHRGGGVGVEIDFHGAQGRDRVWPSMLVRSFENLVLKELRIWKLES